MLVRSPTFRNRLVGRIVSGSRPDSRQAGSMTGGTRGLTPATAAAIRLMWSGVVPQQPPSRLSSPLSANSWTMAAVCSGASSYSPKALGSPALG